MDADGAKTGNSWSNINDAFRSGGRGLGGSGFTSLPDFLDNTYPNERRAKGDLTIAQINKWVDVYRRAHEGAFPSVESAIILNANGSDTGEIWSGVDGAFRRGSRGLGDSGFTSLANFLDKTYSDERRNRGSLTSALIKAWVDIYRAGHKGKFPSQHSGPIFHADGSSTGETWSGVHFAFYEKWRGLKDSGFNSLADFLNKTYPAERGRVELVKKEKPDDINSLLNLI